MKATDENAQEAIGTPVTKDGRFGHVVSVCDFEGFQGEVPLKAFRVQEYDDGGPTERGWFLEDVEIPEKAEELCPMCGKKI